MRFTKTQVLLVLLFLLAFSLRFFRIGQDGFGNLYYAATVQSLLTSWHAFFFASFDPSGFVSVDKPPLGFWIQALSVLVFGFHGWSLILPQALAGSLSVLVLYKLVQRTFGKTAGLLAALILAVTPISVATARNNTPDSLLTFVVLLAAWAAIKAAETGKLRWLLASAALVGIGFNIKMLQAYLVVPALFLFLPPPHGLLKRMGQLTLAMLVMFAVSFAWPIAVDSTPADQRPYVGSTSTNNEMELVAVHNGVRRLGKIVAIFGIREKNPTPATPTPTPAPTQPVTPPPAADSIKIWPDGGLPEVGDPGLLRLFNPQMAGQVSWLLPLALLALVSGMVRTSWKLPLGKEALFYSMWAGWLIPAALFFSYGGLIHRYYLDMLAPPVAALSAVGLSTWMEDFNAKRRSAWLMPLAILLTVATAIFFLGYYEKEYFDELLMGLTVPSTAALAFWSVGFFKGQRAGWRAALITAAILTLALSALGFLPRMNPVFLPILVLGLGGSIYLIFRFRSMNKTILIPILFSMLLVPFVWATTPLWIGGDVTLPHASPDLVYYGGQRDHLSKYEWLAGFLQAQFEDETFLVATENAVVASPLQLLTQKPVMALGGFTGADPILTVDELSQRVADGDVRFFLLGHVEQRNLVQMEISDNMDWLIANCTLLTNVEIPPDLDLYDCHPR
ncbi:MAG: glycosyltransferase family 39 protein [Chloroflexi bacterium]|nr:glycosyltransferase family 39 protein [Chloroflexota bacterium]